jgi:hypothetical protein
MAALELWLGLVLEDGRRLGDVCTDWQLQLLLWALDPDAEPNRIELRPRGGSKTTDVAGMLIVLLILVFAPGTRAYCFAVDRDQARLITDAIAGFVARTPALAGALTVNNFTITSRSGSVLEVMASDSASAWGLKPAFAMLDEWCQWPDTQNSRTLWEAITSSMGKVPGARLLCASTAGDPGSWQFRVYESAQKSPNWSVASIDGPLPWVTKEFLAEQRAMLPDSAFQRLHRNRWAAPEDRLAAADDVRACVAFSIADGQWPLPKQAGVGRYVMGVDLSLVRDRAVAAVMHAERAENEDGQRIVTRVVLDRLQVWKPSHKDPLDFAAVEQWITYAAAEYGCVVYVDPYQAMSTVQRIRNRGGSIEPVNFTMASNDRMAVGLHTLIRSHRLAIPDDEELIEELMTIRLVEKSGQFKLEHDASRHNDRGTALSLAILQLTQIQPQGTRPIIYSDEEMAAHKISVAATLGNGTVAVPGFPSRVTVAKAGFAMPDSVLRSDADFEDDTTNGRTSGPAIEPSPHSSTKRSPFSP